MRKTLSIILFIAVICSTAAQKLNLKQIDRFIQKAQTEWDAPGLSVAIVKDGEIVFEKGYGTMEIETNQKPDEHTLYAIASNTKAFTAAIISQLVDEGKLDWNDKVQKYLPYFEVYDATISKMVTVQDLLSHNVGLGTFSGDAIWYKSELSTEEIVKRIKFIKPVYEFRNGYGYSNLMFITAGDLIEKLTGKSFKQNVTERFLEPLNMDNTVVSVNDYGSNSNVATPHGRRDGENYKIDHVAWDNVQSTGGLVSSVHDMAKWIIFNMNNGIIDGDTLISRSNRNKMWSLQNSFEVNQAEPNTRGQRFNGYGLGWFITNYHDAYQVGHGGGYDGMISSVQMLPDENLGVVVLTNGVKVPTNAIVHYIFDQYLDRPEKDWSTEMLEGYNKWKASDTRVADRKAARVEGTVPILDEEDIIGRYYTPAYGHFSVIKEGDELKLYWEHSPLLSSTLKHFNYDSYEMEWDHPQVWFDFGTVEFEKDAYNKVTGISFDVPNDDFFMNELNAYRVED